MPRSIYIFLLVMALSFSGLFRPSLAQADVAEPIIDELSIRDMDIREVIEIIARKGDLNIVTGQGVEGRATIFLSHVSAKEALRMVLEANGLAYADEGGIVRVMTAADFRSRYGHPFGMEKVTRIIRINFVPIQDMAALLEEMKSPTGKVIANEATKNLIIIDSADKVRIMEDLIHDMDVQTVTQAISLRNIKAQDILEDVRVMLTQSVGVVECNVETNQLVVTDTLSRISRVESMIEDLDARGRRVDLQVKLVHIALNDENLGGVDWSGSLDGLQRIRLFGDYDFLDGRANDRLLSLGLIEDSDLSTLLEALDTVGLVKEYPVSDIQIGQDQAVRIVVKLEDPSLDLYRIPVDDVVSDHGFGLGSSSLEFFVKLGVTPDDQIEARVVPREPNARLNGSGENVRSFVGPEDTLVLGGIVVTEKIARTHKIPLMGDLPLLGFAFRFHNSSVSREEFVLFLAPRIVGSIRDLDADIPSDEGSAQFVEEK